jgi:uncharacterized spore protein YtfJ
MPQLNGEESIVQRIAEAVGGRAGVALAYGDPVERAGVTIVPVARVRFGFGGGVGQGRRREVESRAHPEGSGGGGGAIVAPAGVLILKGDRVLYQPIRDPARMIGLVLAIGVGVTLMLRAVARLTR